MIDYDFGGFLIATCTPTSSCIVPLSRKGETVLNYEIPTFAGDKN